MTTKGRDLDYTYLILSFSCKQDYRIFWHDKAYASLLCHKVLAVYTASETKRQVKKAEIKNQFHCPQSRQKATSPGTLAPTVYYIIIVIVENQKKINLHLEKSAKI